MEAKFIGGFSKLSKEEKIRFVTAIIGDPGFPGEAASYWHSEKQEMFDSFSENTITNYYLPFGVAPNFRINNKIYHVPMVVEESSVVAAASSAAKFWSTLGGFRAEVISTLKKGHVHFLWFGSKEALTGIFPAISARILIDTNHLTIKMKQRGGGIRQIALDDFSSQMEGYYRISVDFETVDSMGANFINSVLEVMAVSLRSSVSEMLASEIDKLEVIMSILSNHVPECLVECHVSCESAKFDKLDNESSWQVFTHKFKTAVDIANIDPYRAATHNKGIMNGIDAVVIATGNDFRAVEAGAHAYAALSGTYKSLSWVEIDDTIFTFKLKMPIAIGTVGGLTVLHPMSKRAMQLLGNPDAKELMMIVAAAGLASNFSAVKALVTKGIQKGHMKMHLSNMLMQYNLKPDQRKELEEYFRTKEISYSAVHNYIEQQFPGSI